MARGINLLIPAQKTPEWQIQLSRLAKTGSVVLLIFYILLTGGVFSFWFYTQQTLRGLTQEKAIKEKKIADLKDIESSQVLLKQRLSALKKFFDNPSTDHAGIFSFFSQSVTTQIEVKDIDFSTSGTVSVRGSAANVYLLSDFLDQISGESGKKLFSRIVLSSISRKEDGGYFFDLNLYAKDQRKSG